MSELVDFLTARLDEDEAVARAVPPPLFERDPFDARFTSWESDHSEADNEFVRRFDPARVLREMAAKRATLDGLRDAEAVVARIGPDLTGPGDAAEWANYHAWLDAAEAAAAVFSDHPDFQEQWR